ncbi:hypothetical protein BH10BDE1_BH10BDE1_20330 [soil metagenome]
MNLLNRVVLTLSIAGSIALNFACSPGGSGGGPGAPDAAKAPTLQGTVSGGGGNGCDGKAFEAFSKKISTLEEYRLYLKPMLQRMVEEGSDPLVTYLLWAAEEKAWYFIPCELQKLSSEQTGVAVQSDQLAVHGEHGVYIHSRENEPNANSYFSKKSKAKAALLLHEMVMGARLLMKKSAKEQCTALAKKDAKLCADPEIMAIAEAKVVDPKQAMIMDASDHEAVRAMTSYLSEKGADLSSEKVRATRERLGFNFPWSRAVSDVNHRAIVEAFARSMQLKDSFKVASTAAYFKGEAATCSISHSVWQLEQDSSVEIAFVSKYQQSKPQDYDAFTKKFGSNSTSIGVCAARKDQVFSPYASVPGTNAHIYSECQDKTMQMGWYTSRATFQLETRKIAVRGVLVDGVVYDEVSFVTFNAQDYQFRFDGRMVEAAEIRILLTRDEAPRLYSIRMTPKQKLMTAQMYNSSGDSDTRQASEKSPELLEIPDMPAVECINGSLKK